MGGVGKSLQSKRTETAIEHTNNAYRMLSAAMSALALKGGSPVKPYCKSRLTIVGPARDLSHFFAQHEWKPETGILHVELMEKSRFRHIWQFDGAEPPLQFITRLSDEWPFLTFLLDYDREDKRIKGLAKALKGQLRHLLVNY